MIEAEGSMATPAIPERNGALAGREHLVLLARLEAEGLITSTSLSLPPGIPWNEYVALLSMLGEVHEGARWQIGDGINYGEREYGETYTQAVAATGLAEQTLTNYASVCRHIPRARRHADLSFSHHAEVAYLEPAEQERLLRLASEHRWRRNELRAAAAPHRKPRPTVELSWIAEEEVQPPPAEQEVLCQCMTCGRWHRADHDVAEVS